MTVDDCLDLATASADLLSPSLHPTWPIVPHVAGRLQLLTGRSKQQTGRACL
jgi:hypothetical protein